MKKLFFLLLVMLLAVCLVACNGDDAGTPPDGGDASEGGSGNENNNNNNETEDGNGNENEDGGESGGTETEPDEPSEPAGKPTVDMSGVSFTDKTVRFSGHPQSILITGTLPEGVEVTYTGNRQTKPGSYTVTARFTAPKGYADIAPMHATLRIEEPSVKDGGLVFVDDAKTHLYTLEDYSYSVLSLPEGVVRIAEDAMVSATGIKGVYIPASVKLIGLHAVGYEKVVGGYQKLEGFTVYGETGSAAETWCKNNGIPFDAVHMPKVYASASELYEAGMSDEAARRHLAELITHHGIDIASYGVLFDVQIRDAAAAVKDLKTSVKKLDLQAALAEHLMLENAVTLTIQYLDTAGEQVLRARTVKVKVGVPYSIKTPAVLDHYTRTLYVKGAIADDTMVKVTYKATPKNVDSAYLKTLFPDISCWGDSITHGIAGRYNVDSANALNVDLAGLGSSASGDNYVQVLSNLIRRYVYGGVTVHNNGVGGETSAVIAARAGAEGYQLYLDKAATVSSYATVISIAQNASSGRLGILRQGDGHTINPVTMVGEDEGGNPVTVTGRIELSLADGAPASTNIQTCDYSLLKYTFYRTDGGEGEVYLTKNTKIVTSGSYLYDGTFCIIFIGQNGGYANAAELIRQQEQMLKALECGENYLIISTLSGTASSRESLRKALAEKWGDKYINMGTALTAEETYRLIGLSDEAIAADASSIATGKVSGIFTGDGVHPTALGYAAVGNVIFERMADLGYFDPIFDYYDSLGG